MILRQRRGFTLIEVMIVVAIVGILAALALPSYSNYLRRGRISDAVSTLSNHRTAMEQFFQDNRTYDNACNNGSIAATPTSSNYFDFTCTPAGAVYTLTATGKGSMLSFGYLVDQANARSTTSVPPGWTLPPTNNCWALKQDGSC
jgi:type IV pilus assembly protein PilE